LNLYEICIEVLEHANDSKKNLDSDIDIQSIATDIYDLFYEHQVYTTSVDTGYLMDLKEYWDFKQDLNEDE
tara:strand:- start:886 stop:1098 length:213 start_codon:yes stop_codon:yes gene_type:complete